MGSSEKDRKACIVIILDMMIIIIVTYHEARTSGSARTHHAPSICDCGTF